MSFNEPKFINPQPVEVDERSKSPRAPGQLPNYMTTTTTMAAKENKLVETNKKQPRARKTFMDGYKAQADLHDRYSLYKIDKPAQKTKKKQQMKKDMRRRWVVFYFDSAMKG